MKAIWLENRGILRVSGEDRVTFLQGLVSNDVRKVNPEQALHSAFLTAQGKFLHEFFLVESKEAFLLEAESVRLADLKKRLSLYKLRSKVVIEEAPDLKVAVAFGEKPDKPAGTAWAFGGGVAYVDPRLAEAGLRFILSDETDLSAYSMANTEEYDLHRLTLGLPDGSRDLLPEKSILLENGFEELNGVDWEKGCYCGQELTARTRYRGLIKRRLFPVRIEGSTPPSGLPITKDGEEAGEMRSARGNRGLALLRLDKIEGDGFFTCGDSQLFVEKLDWMKLPEVT
jgi:folate-binding protein YgfZ